MWWFRVLQGDWVRGYRLGGSGGSWRGRGGVGELGAAGVLSPFRAAGRLGGARVRGSCPRRSRGADDSGQRDQRANDSDPRRLTQIRWDRTLNDLGRNRQPAEPLVPTNVPTDLARPGK